MLVVSRLLGERVICTIGGVRMEIQIIRVAGKKVRLGIEAPQEVRILRGELEEVPASGDNPTEVLT